MLSSRGDNSSSSLVKHALSKSHQSIYSTKINKLVKENSQLKTDYEKLKKEMTAFEKALESKKKEVTEKDNRIKHLEKVIYLYGILKI